MTPQPGRASTPRSPGPTQGMTLLLQRKLTALFLRALYLLEVHQAGELDAAPPAITEPVSCSSDAYFRATNLRRAHAESLLAQVRCPLVYAAFSSAIRCSLPHRLTRRTLYRLLGDAVRTAALARLQLRDLGWSTDDLTFIQGVPNRGLLPLRARVLQHIRVVHLEHRTA